MIGATTYQTADIHRAVTIVHQLVHASGVLSAHNASLTICTLPPEILCYIFMLEKPYRDGYAVAQVCRHFRAVASDDQNIWTDINLVCFHRVEELLAHSGTMPVRVHITLGKRLMRRLVPLDGKTLKEARAYLAPRMGEAWAHVITHCAHRLAAVDIDFLPEIPPAVIAHLSQHRRITFGQLTRIHIAPTERDTDFAQHLLAHELPVLQRLEMRRCIVDESDLARVLSPRIDTLMVRVPYHYQWSWIDHLTGLVNLDVDLWHFYIPDTVETISLQFPTLRKLGLRGKSYVVQWFGETVTAPALEVVRIKQNQWASSATDLKPLLTQVFPTVQQKELSFTYTVTNIHGWTYKISNDNCYVKVHTDVYTTFGPGLFVPPKEAVAAIRGVLDQLRFLLHAVETFSYLCPMPYLVLENCEQVWLSAMADSELTNIKRVLVNQYSAQRLFLRWKADSKLQSVLEDVDVQIE
jgi:hypothetical protein